MSAPSVVVVGPGAVGGLLAHRLHSRGQPVLLLATERRARQIADGGLVLRAPGDGPDDAVRPPVVTTAQAAGPHDVVLLCLKSTALVAAAPSLRPLLGPGTVVVSAMNGVPWWFLHGAPGPFGGRRIAAVDADGSIVNALPGAQCLGCVVHLAASLDDRGRIVRGNGNRLIVGDPSGRGVTPRTALVTALLARAGFDAEPSDDIRRAIWLKLWGNLTMNPISALTGATADRILDDPLVRALVLQMMAEAEAIGVRLGLPMDMGAEQRIGMTRQLGAFKTSMLQDQEAGRPLEVDAIVRAVQELGALVGVPSPAVDAVLGLVALKARSA